MPIAAIQGCSQPLAASGTAVALYTTAHAMFCRIMCMQRRAVSTPTQRGARASPSNTTSALTLAKSVPAADRHRNVGSCQHGRVIHAVPDHRHDVALALQRTHQRHLVAGSA